MRVKRGRQYFIWGAFREEGQRYPHLGFAFFWGHGHPHLYIHLPRVHITIDPKKLTPVAVNQFRDPYSRPEFHWKVGVGYSAFVILRTRAIRERFERFMYGRVLVWPS